MWFNENVHANMLQGKIYTFISWFWKTKYSECQKSVLIIFRIVTHHTSELEIRINLMFFWILSHIDMVKFIQQEDLKGPFVYYFMHKLAPEYKTTDLL
jgi:hypothetical protein